MKVIHDLEQGSAEWLRERLCCITGSRADELMGTDLARVQLIAELIAEEGTEAAKVNRMSPEMERGHHEEAFALKLFAEKYKKNLVRVGICVSDDLPWVKCSPDSLIDNNGEYDEAVEVKSPDSKTAVFYKLTNIIGMQELNLGTWPKPTKDNPNPEFKPSAKVPFLGIPADYKWQGINYFFVNEKLKRLYFVIYDARFIDEDQRLYVIEIERDDPQVQAALAEYRASLNQLRIDWLKWRDVILPTKF